MGVSYNRNVGLALDADLTLLVVNAGVSKRGVAQTRIWSETQGFSDPRLKWSAELLRLALDLECGVTQTRVSRDAELLKLASNAGLLRPASEVSVLLWMRGPRFSLKRDLHIEMWFTSDDLPLVIFGQPIEFPLKFLKLRSWLGRISKYFELQLILGFPWLDWQSFEMSWAWSCLDCGLRECTIELLEVSREDCHECLRNSF